MNELFGQYTSKFRGSKWAVIPRFIVCFIFFILICKEFDSGDIQLLKGLLTGNFKNIPEISWLLLLVILFLIIYLLSIMLIYIANSKSYIELTNTHLIVNKPTYYPFLNMDTLYVSYAEIEDVKIAPSKLGWKIIITQKDGFGNCKIRFFGLDDGRKFNEELKKRGIQSHIYYSGFNMSPDAGD